MTLEIGDRVKIQNFIEKLSTLPFDEVKTDRIMLLFPYSQNIEVEDEDIDGNMKTIEIDDYIFSISSKLPEETCLNGFNINETIVLDKEVSVFVENTNNVNDDIDALGTIIKEGNKYYMHVEFDID